MDQSNLASQLNGIRNNLLAAVSNASMVERKLIGPRPSDSPNKASQPASSVQDVIAEIAVLSMQLVKMLEAQHSIIGDVAGTETLAGNSRSYA